MSQVVSFEDIFPPARFDAVPWTQASIEEGASSDGPWSQIDLLTLTPTDSDPAHPIERNLTTELASDTPNLWYRIIFIDGAANVSPPTQPTQNLSLAGASHDYITREMLKETLALSGLSFADDDIDSSITAASRAVDDMTYRYFWRGTDDETRFYAPTWSQVPIDDLISLTSIEVIDNVGDSTLLVESTDFMLYPPNAPASNFPYSYVKFLPGSTTPAFYLPSVKVTGTFGWPVVPEAVVTATTILAARFLRRQREAPFGIVTVGIETGTAARIMASDPDVKTALCDYVKPQVMIA